MLVLVIRAVIVSSFEEMCSLPSLIHTDDLLSVKTKNHTRIIHATKNIDLLSRTFFFVSIDNLAVRKRCAARRIHKNARPLTVYAFIRGPGHSSCEIVEKGAQISGSHVRAS